MAVYYIDPIEGRVENTGRSEALPLKTNKGLLVVPGDTVLFKRGSVIRDALWNVNGSKNAPITYGAYGEGKKPVFCGSEDLTSPMLWKEIRENIWECTRKLPTDACNFIFNDKEEFGSLVWNENELGRNGDWWDSGFADDGTMASQDHRTLLYCEKNPADYYEHIECVLHKYRSLGETGENMVIEDLIFCNNGIHGIAGENPARNIMIRNCEFYHIGGCVWSLSQKIRFGNGVECWNIAENVTVENCKFDDIYDSAVTHQGGPECETAKGFYIRNNEFSRCGMAAYEQRDRLPKEGEFSGNICLDAGRGFSHFRTEIPRNSEIWPQPMGHHIFLWRIEQGETLCDFKIENNTFKDAPYGAAIYSIIHPEAEKQLTFANNHYEMKQFEMIAHLSGKMIMDPEKCIELTENPQSE